MTDTTSRPDWRRPEAEAAAPDLALCRALLAGTRALHADARTYLRKYEGESDANYQRRSASVPLWGGYARTVAASTGLLFAAPPVVSEPATPEAARIASPDDTAGSDWEDVDRQGTHGAVFAKRLAEDALVDGYVGVLVEFPRVGAVLGEDRVPTLAEERALGLRPYWVRYRRAQVVSWRVGPVPGRTTPVLTQLVLHEAADVDAGAYGQERRDRFRVLRLVVSEVGLPVVTVTVYEQASEDAAKAGEDPFTIVEEGVYRGIADIPFAVCYAGRTDAPFCAAPPLLDVAWANLDHWRLATAIRYLEELTCFPTPVLEGELAPDPLEPTKPAVFRIGPHVLVQLSTGGKFSWAELEGKSLDQLRASLADKRDEVAFLGMSFLAGRKQAAETARAKQIDATAEHATLATAAQGIEDGLNAALGFHAAYYGLPADAAPTVSLNREFDVLTLDAQMVGVLLQARTEGAITPDLWLALLKRGRVIPQGHDLTAEAAALAVEQIAREEREAERLAAEQDARDAMGGAGAP